MGKDKLRKFRENLTFDCFIQPEFDEVFRCDHPLKGHWRSDFFHNDNPIVLELGCGKGEYTVALADEVVRRYGLPCEVSNADIYGTGYADEVLSVKTAYEKRFLEMGLPITYTRFSLAGRHKFPWFDWEEDEKAEKDNEEARLG